jgi:hypothetical protein
MKRRGVNTMHNTWVIKFLYSLVPRTDLLRNVADIIRAVREEEVSLILNLRFNGDKNELLVRFQGQLGAVCMTGLCPSLFR